MINFDFIKYFCLFDIFNGNFKIFGFKFLTIYFEGYESPFVLYGAAHDKGSKNIDLLILGMKFTFESGEHNESYHLCNFFMMPFLMVSYFIDIETMSIIAIGMVLLFMFFYHIPEKKHKKIGDGSKTSAPY